MQFQEVGRGQDRGKVRDKANPGPGTGHKYGGLYQDRVPSCNFMGEENEVNLEEVILGCLWDIQGRAVPEAFISPSL